MVERGAFVSKENRIYSLTDYANMDIRASRLMSTSSAANNTASRIKTFLSNPISNYTSIVSAMQSLYHTNGTFNRVINYYASMPTYNYGIYPSPNAKNNFELSGSLEEFLTVAEQIDKYEIKRYAPYFVKQTLIQGMSFFYEISDGNGVVYMEFPPSMCIITGIENGVYRFGIDVSKLPDEIGDLKGFPSELVKAKTDGSKSNPDKWIEDTYYIVSNKGFALTFDQSAIRNGGIGLPEHMSLLEDASLIESAKNNVAIKDKIDTVRLLSAKIPMDKDGNPKMNPKTAQKWNQVINASTPDGVGVFVTPLEVQSLNVAGTNNAAYTNLDGAQRQMMTSAGTPSVLFGGDIKSAAILTMSVNKDASWMYNTVLPILEAYYNEVLSKIKTESGNSWKINIIKQNIYSRKDDISYYKDAVTLGGSRTDYLASIGYTPMESYAKLNMEQDMLKIDELMKPKPTSYTMSGTETNETIAGQTVNPEDEPQENNEPGEAGRIEEEEPSEETERQQ